MIEQQCREMQEHEHKKQHQKNWCCFFQCSSLQEYFIDRLGSCVGSSRDEQSSQDLAQGKAEKARFMMKQCLEKEEFFHINVVSVSYQ